MSQTHDVGVYPGVSTTLPRLDQVLQGRQVKVNKVFSYLVRVWSQQQKFNCLFNLLFFDLQVCCRELALVPLSIHFVPGNVRRGAPRPVHPNY